MELLRTVADLSAWRRQAQAEGASVAFVPTMGYLHAGHQRLMEAARADGLRLVVSIFVNPLQFGPGEDFERYPRDEAGDLARIAAVDPEAAVFLPAVSDMYPQGFATRVNVRGVTEPLCGRSRPGHFEGVATVVARLFGLVRPDRAYFGLKDYQQVVTIRTMVRDLALGVEIVGVPTVREPDGLAMSSRNVYLDGAARQQAVSLSRGLGEARRAWAEGVRDPEGLRVLVQEALREAGVREDYVEVLDAEDLAAPRPDRPVVVAVAAFVGRARLIDNLVLTP